MIINEILLEKEPDFKFELLAPKERIIFFDIETTGLSASNSSIYLIGAVFYEQGHWMLRQFFAENMGDETQVLAGFFKLLNERKKLGRLFLISFNGDTFDIPFIKNCIRQYALMYDFTGTFSIDLMKKIRPYKKLAELENCKLKTVERLCGICREDKYNGGELIYVYEEYLRLSHLDPESCEYTPLNMKLKDQLLKALLLHNAEDIMDMPFIMDILGYESLMNGAFAVEESVIADGVWDIHARLETPLPKGVYYESPEYVISISEEDKLALNIAVTLYEGEVKNFFTDYKNYYYLPAEDCAIHKSVGEFVDKKARKQATAKTCYQKLEGTFIPQPEAVFPPMLYKDYKVLPGYGRIPEQISSEDTARYILAVLRKELDL